MNVVAVGPQDEALLLDLLNTTPVVEGVPRDDLTEPKAARAWMRERGIAPTDAELASLLEARSLMQSVVRGEQTPEEFEKEQLLEKHLEALLSGNCAIALCNPLIC